MPGQVTKYNVFIASPGDVEEERRVAIEAIHRWNGLNADHKQVIFQPLQWERGSVPDADAPPQDVINKELLDRADLLIGILWSRLGTPTDRFASGTVEELKTFPGRKMVYFSRRPVVLAEDADPVEAGSDAKAVTNFRKELGGYSRRYKDTTEFERMIFNDLTAWANLEAHYAPVTCVRPYELTADGHPFLDAWHESDEDGEILLYNPELASFRSPEAFEAVWGSLPERRNIRKVVMVLPKYKKERLSRHLSGFPDTFSRIDQGRFHYCEVERAERGAAFRAGLGFALFHAGEPVRTHPRGLLFVLAPPFAEEIKSESAGSDMHWDYRYAVDLVGEEAITSSLLKLWRSHHARKEERPVSDLIRETPKTKQLLDEIDEIASDKKAPPFDECFDLALEVRSRLFDPNVPTYVLNHNFFLLDWNPTFELIFPTHRFRRGQNVNHFLECLANYDDTLLHGEKSFMDPNNYPLFHEEVFKFDSPRYGRMEFTKVTSPVRRNSPEIIGWNVALNVDAVQERDQFEEDRIKANEFDALLSRYAHAYDAVTSKYPAYRDLAERHVAALAGCTNVLDLGAGPGQVTAMLVEAGKSVTALDVNDAMLQILRARCAPHSGTGRLRIAKMNVEALRPSMFDDETFDGASLLNVLYQLPNPGEFLEHVKSVLNPGATIVISGPRVDADIHSLFQDIERGLSEKERAELAHHLTVFKQVNYRFLKDRIIRGMGQDRIKRLLTAAGFTVLEDQCVERVYGDQGTFVVARLG